MASPKVALPGSHKEAVPGAHILGLAPESEPAHVLVV